MSDTPRTDAAPTYWIAIAQKRTVNIDFARTLERELAEAQEEAERYRWLRDNSYNVQIGLERELAEARKDAERYRWLRENNFQEPTPKGFRTTLEEIDAAIDAAIRKGE